MSPVAVLFVSNAITLLALVFTIHMLLKMWHAVQWILRHVHVVPKNQEQDPDLIRIKRLFGIEEK